MSESIRKREARLRAHYRDVTGCRVTTEDRPPRAFERALDAAFAAAERQLAAPEPMLHER